MTRVTLVQVPESLGDDLCESNGWRVVLPTRSGALDVALEVIAVGSNVVSLIGLPENLKGSLETIRSWLCRQAPETVVEIHSGSDDIRIVIRDEADAEAAIAIVAASLARVKAN